MTPLPKAQVQQTAQVLLAALSDERCVTPNNLLEGVVSGKSLLRGILNGQFVVCMPAQAQPETPTPADPPKRKGKKAAEKNPEIE